MQPPWMNYKIEDNRVKIGRLARGRRQSWRRNHVGHLAFLPGSQYPEVMFEPRLFQMEDSGQQYLHMIPPYSFTTPVYEFATPSNAALSLAAFFGSPHINCYPVGAENETFMLTGRSTRLSEQKMKQKLWAHNCESMVDLQLGYYN
uniref:Uncharacterized protein n=1 Tax=Aegilops tauschii TaxID=37682 RepID=M8BM10_AEGTA